MANNFFKQTKNTNVLIFRGIHVNEQNFQIFNLVQQNINMKWRCIQTTKKNWKKFKTEYKSKLKLDYLFMLDMFVKTGRCITNFCI